MVLMNCDSQNLFMQAQKFISASPAKKNYQMIYAKLKSPKILNEAMIFKKEL